MHWKISGVGFTKHAVNIQLHWVLTTMVASKLVDGFCASCTLVQFVRVYTLQSSWGSNPPLHPSLSPPFSLRSSHSQQKTGYFLNWSLLPLLIPRPPASHLLSSSSSRFSILFLGRLVVIVGSRSSVRFYRIPRTHVIRISDIAHVVAITRRRVFREWPGAALWIQTT